jgi:Telomere recombination
VISPVIDTGGSGHVHQGSAGVFRLAKALLFVDLPGLAALADSSEGIAAIYAAKRRQLHSPLAICVGDAFDIPRYAETEHLPRG